MSILFLKLNFLFAGWFVRKLRGWGWQRRWSIRRVKVFSCLKSVPRPVLPTFLTIAEIGLNLNRRLVWSCVNYWFWIKWFFHCFITGFIKQWFNWSKPFKHSLLHVIIHRKFFFYQHIYLFQWYFYILNVFEEVRIF